MARIALDIKNCQQCPHYDSKIIYTADSFERDFDMICKKANRTIAGYVSPWEADKEAVPEWCPAKE